MKELGERDQEKAIKELEYEDAYIFKDIYFQSRQRTHGLTYR